MCRAPDKKFQPISKDAEDELYPNGIFVFNITKLLMFIKANPHIFQPEEVSIKTIRLHSSHLNESTIQTANTMEPIILAEIAPDRFNVIDGHHRLEKAYREGASNNILAYKVSAEQHIKFLTSVEAYKEYIIYWNSKIQQYIPIALQDANNGKCRI